MFVGTTWPFACNVSLMNMNLLPKEQHDELRAALFSEAKDMNLDECIVDFAFAVLIGGKGSPPHVDTIANLLRPNNTSGKQRDWMVDLTLAIGYLIQGVKYFWALPPKGQHARRYLEYYEQRPPPSMTTAQKLFRKDILEGRMPHPFQGKYSMGWPSETDWRGMMENKGIPNHFHKLVAHDIYIVTDGSFHAAWNSPDYQTASVAHDDAWAGGQPDLRSLTAKLTSDCKG
jgi:hypothetical protein